MIRINDIFPHRISEPHVVKLITDIFVCNAIAHEYIHVQQHEQGRITVELMIEQNRFNYEEREIEIEAAKGAIDLLIQHTSLEEERVEQILKGYIDNDSANELSEYLLEWESRRVH